MRGKKEELVQFLSKKGIDICLLDEAHLRDSESFRMANYVCHRNDRPTRGGGTAILVRRGIDHHAVPISGLQQLEATAVQLNLGGRPVKLVAVYIAPDRPILDDDLSECFRGNIPVLMAGDLNAKHKDWNSRVNSRRGELLREYVSTNSCIVHGPTTHTTAPFNSANLPDVLDIVVVKDFVLPVNLTVCHALSSDHLPVLVDTPCRASFQVPPDLPNLKRVDWAHFQDHLAAGLPGETRVETMEDIDASLETLTKAIQDALRVAAPKRRPDEDRSRPVPPFILVKIREKNWLRRTWLVTRDPATKLRINQLQRQIGYELGKWRNEQWAATLESLTPEDTSLWKMTRRIMRIEDPNPPLQAPGGLANSDLEKAEALASNLESQFQPVPVPPAQAAAVETVREFMQSFALSPTSEPQLTTLAEVSKAVRELKVGKAPGPNGVPNTALRHLPDRALTFLTVVFNAVLRLQYYPSVWKHARVISILKPGKDPTLPSSYRPISLLDTVGKLFEKILLARILREVNDRGLIRDEQFGFRPKLSTTLQLARLVERVMRNFDEKRLTGAVFLDVAKAFDSVWIEGLLYKLILLDFPSYLVKTISSYLTSRTFVASFRNATSSRRFMRAGVAQGGVISPVLFTLYVNDIPTPCRHVELAQYADDTALVATSGSTKLLAKYLETYLIALERWLREWRIAINVDKSMAVLFSPPRRRIPNPRGLRFLGVEIQWVETAR